MSDLRPARARGSECRVHARRARARRTGVAWRSIDAEAPPQNVGLRRILRCIRGGLVREHRRTVARPRIAASRRAGCARSLLRRASPLADDLLSLLIHACDDADRLTDGELLSLVSGLLIGGSDTTVHLTTYTLHELLRHPDQMALLRADPGLTRSALDETLRYNSFGRGGGLARFVREEFTYEGVTLRRGQPVFLNMLSAFRDPEFVADADVFDIRRRTHSSPWFGYGPHFCVGASLARMEAEMALQMFLARYPTIELAGPAVYGTHPILRDIVDLPVRVDSAAGSPG